MQTYESPIEHFSFHTLLSQQPPQYPYIASTSSSSFHNQQQQQQQQQSSHQQQQQQQQQHHHHQHIHHQQYQQHQEQQLQEQHQYQYAFEQMHSHPSASSSTSQPGQQDQVYSALENFLMGISPYPPTMPTLAKPTCPPLPEVPAIILNEQSMDLMQQYYHTKHQQPISMQNSMLEFEASCYSGASSPSFSLSSLSSNASTSGAESDLAAMVLPSSTSSAAIITTTATTVARASSKKASTGLKQKSHRRNLSVASSSDLSYQQELQHRRASSTSACSDISSSLSAPPSPSVSGMSLNSSTTSSSRVKSYACPTCTKPFPTRTQLKSHMAIHTDLFPFPCLYAGCDLHFKRKHDLRRHVDAKHALVKKYLCTGGCGEGFGRRDQMVRHIRRGTCGQHAGSLTE